MPAEILDPPLVIDKSVGRHMGKSMDRDRLPPTPRSRDGSKWRDGRAGELHPCPNFLEQKSACLTI